MIEKYLTDSYKSILCLNGDIAEESFLKKTKLPIFAADGAGNTLIQKGINPELVIGDLDSFQPHLTKHIKTKHEPCQNSSDFQKALEHLSQENLLPTIILGMSGGFIDHILNNINIFIESDCVFYTSPIMGCVLKGQKKFSFPKNTKVSLMGMPSSIVSTKGLKWELDRNILTFPGVGSCFNRTILETINIDVHEGALLALFYLQHIEDNGI